MAHELLVPLRPVLVTVFPAGPSMGDTVVLVGDGHLYTYDGATWVDNGSGTSTGIAAIAAGSQTATSGSVLFVNSNGISFGMSGSSQITASYTVPSTTEFITAINVAAGTTNSNLTAMSFVNAHNVSFGMTAGTITASVVPGAGGDGGWARPFLIMGG